MSIILGPSKSSALLIVSMIINYLTSCIKCTSVENFTLPMCHVHILVHYDTFWTRYPPATRSMRVLIMT